MAPFNAKFDRATSQPEYTVAEPAEPIFDIAAFQKLNLADAEITAVPPAELRLDFEGLDCFEAVEAQFADLGVTFSNAIALHPSNPAYPPLAGKTAVLMGAPKSGWLEACFRRPVRFVSGSVTSSRHIVMAAFDANDQPLGQTAGSANLAGSNTLPNMEISLNAANIHRVTFRAFNGQLTLGEFRFGL